MIYRIITNHGHVDTSFNKENADRKFNKYVKYMEDGYSSFVMMTEQKGMYGKEEVIKKVCKIKSKRPSGRPVRFAACG